MMIFFYILLFINISFIKCLDNGLALTPPMGWMTWERFRCSVDCDLYEDNCLNENLIKSMADLMVKDGFRDLGYKYIIIDDCWAEKERNHKGELEADKHRFPNGMKYLANYIHQRGLKFGIYSDFGTLTCGRYPGSEFYIKTDADTFASWDVDYVKMDGCYADSTQMNDGYPEFSKWLNNTGKSIVFSCSWPDYQDGNPQKANYTYISKYCNLWRNYVDIQDSWASVQSIIKFYGDNQDTLVPVAGPGHWNDPDMLILGNFGLSYEQSKAQMAFWALLSAPLIMSNDLRRLDSRIRDILLDKDIIDINQDSLGKQGKRMHTEGKLEVWMKPLKSTTNHTSRGEYDNFAFILFNSGDNGAPRPFFFCPKNFGLTQKSGYRMIDLYNKNDAKIYSNFDYRIIFPESNITLFIPPSSVIFLRIYNITLRDMFSHFFTITIGSN